MTTIDWKNILSRAAWTFAEGFLVALPLDGGLTRAAVLGALMAGLSAVKTVLVDFARAKM